MMNYEMFKEVLEESFLSYLPEKYHGTRLKMQSLDGSDFMGIELHNVSKYTLPTFCVNDLFKDYLLTENFHGTLKLKAEEMDEVYSSIQEICNTKWTQNDIIFELVNTEKNEEKLQNIPHRKFEDLTIMYRLLRFGERGTACTKVDNEVAREMGLEEKQMFELAMGNTKRILPPVIATMNEIFLQLLVENGMVSDEFANSLNFGNTSDDTVYHISNSKHLYGASFILYEDELHNLAEEIGSSLYIMLSSVHEVLALSTKTNNPCKLEQLVKIINNMAANEDEEEEELSNRIYH
jgi:hypothetical protein